MNTAKNSPERSHLWQRLTYAVLAVYWLALFAVTHVPRLPPPPNIPQSDKLAHLLAYGLLSVLFLTARASLRRLRTADYFWSFVVLAGYGVFDELSQIPVGRSGEVFDWVADVAGILLGMAIFIAWRALRERLRPSPEDDA